MASPETRRRVVPSGRASRGSVTLRNAAVASIWACACLPVGAHTPDAAPTPAPPIAHSSTEAPAAESLEVRIARASSLYDAEEYGAADALLRPVLDDPRFATLPEEFKVAAFALSGGASLAARDIERAFAMFEQANASPAASAELASATLDLALEFWRPERTIAPLRVLAAQAPDKVRALDDRTVFQIHVALREARAPRAERVRFLRALFDAGRVMRDGREPSGLWLELARLHLEDGDRAAAAAVARRIASPPELLALQVDFRFADVLKVLDPAQLDLRAAMERELALSSAAVAREPRILSHVVELTYLLLDAGRFEDALAACQTSLAKAAAASAGPAFEDEADSLVWIHDNQARALMGLGRADEAAAVWEPARRMPESGRRNVSQAINVANLHAALGRPQEALAALADVEQASPYGWMQFHAARLAALVETPGDPRALESLRYLREHRSISSGTYMRALLKAGAIDEAARVLVERLADPDERLDALLDVQSYPTSPISPRNAEWMARMRELVARPEVVRAIAAVGRTTTVPYHRYPL